MKLRLYSFAAVIQLRIGGIQIASVSLTAYSYEEAVGQAYLLIQKEYPASSGYFNHYVTGHCVRDDVIRNVFNDIDEK